MEVQPEVMNFLQTGQIIQKLRMDAELTQEQLADQLFVSRELVSKWELGQRRPNIRELREMASLFRVGIDDLIDTNGLWDELASCFPAGRQLSAARFSALLDPFLRTLSERERGVFIRRYYSLEDVSDISTAFDITNNHVRVILSRTRKKLKEYLKGAANERQ
ncbi:MAG: helix-turn-helix domain-containing protein [Clostridia bacterium]|nr:helix-turn-helix domain-containing protein [Clostridia bacterium]